MKTLVGSLDKPGLVLVFSNTEPTTIESLTLEQREQLENLQALVVSAPFPVYYPAEHAREAFALIEKERARAEAAIPKPHRLAKPQNRADRRAAKSKKRGEPWKRTEGHSGRSRSSQR